MKNDATAADRLDYKDFQFFGTMPEKLSVFVNSHEYTAYSLTSFHHTAEPRYCTGGLGILLAIGAAYGGKKLLKARKKKKEVKKEEELLQNEAF